MLTCKRIPIPAKTALDGGNTYVLRQRVDHVELKIEYLPARLRRLGSQRMRTRR